MKTNKAYVAVSFLSVATLLLPSAAIFAKAEVSSGREGEERNELRTGTAIRDDNEGENESEARRSTVSTFVKSLLDVAERNNGGIGEQVRVVAREQAESETTTSQAIAEVEGRNSFKTFLIGTDYKNLGMIRSEMVKTSSRIDWLNRLLERMTTSTGATTTLSEIQSLTQAQTKLEDFLKQNESKFSLFGWFVKLFNK